MKKLLTVFVAVITAFTMMTTNVLCETEAGIYVHVNENEDSTVLADFEFDTAAEGYTVTYKYGDTVVTTKTQLEEIAADLIANYEADNDEVKLVCDKESAEHTHSELGGDCYTEVYNHDGIYYYEKKKKDATTPIDPSVVEEAKNNKYYVFSCDKHVHSNDCFKVVINLTETTTLNEYTVTFNSNGGLFEGKEETVTSINKVTSVEEGYLVEAPIVYRDGYAFVGWVDSNNAAVDPDGQFKESVVLTATWKEIPASGQIGFTYTPNEADQIKISAIEKNDNFTAEIELELVKDEIDSAELTTILSSTGLSEENVAASADFVLNKYFYSVKKNGQTKLVDEYTETEVSSIDGYVEISMDISSLTPCDDAHHREFKVYFLHDGVVQSVDNCQVANGTITFQASMFSAYVVTYQDILNPVPQPEPTPYEIPNTSVR